MAAVHGGGALIIPAIISAAALAKMLSVLHERSRKPLGGALVIPTAAAALATFVVSALRRRCRVLGTAHKATRRLGGSEMRVSVLGQGGASHGDLYTKLDDATALGALAAAHAGGIEFFDTSPYYGVGLSEARFGLALHRVPRDSFHLQTKVGRHLIPDRDAVNGTAAGWIGGYHMKIKFDYSGEALEAQLHDSLQRTGLGRVDSLVIHDLEPTCHRHGDGRADDGVETARKHLADLRRSGFATLQRLRASGQIAAFGAGVNSNEDGEDAATKQRWNREYVSALLSMHEDAHRDAGQGAAAGEAAGEAAGRGIDFLLLANLVRTYMPRAHLPLTALALPSPSPQTLTQTLTQTQPPYSTRFSTRRHWTPASSATAPPPASASSSAGRTRRASWRPEPTPPAAGPRCTTIPPRARSSARGRGVSRRCARRTA